MSNAEFVEKLLKERYCIHNEKSGDERVGDVWDNICGRVANYLGKTDDEVNVFHDIMYRKEFLPNSPTLMNAGTVHPMLSACFKAGTMIETTTIPTPIEMIKIGDSVLSHDGTYNKVIDTVVREDFIYKLKIDKLPPVYVTKEHPIFTNNGWKCVKDLIPKLDFVKIGSPIVSQEVHKITFNGIEINGLTHVEITNKDSISQKKRRHNIQTTPIKNNIIIDADLSWFIGMYLAEGSISKGYDIRFVLNINEQDYASKIVAILKNNFGLKSTVKETLHPTTWLTVRCHSKFLATWLDNNFGHGFDKKYIPYWVYKLDHSCIHSLIQGVDDGDGSNSNYKSRQIVLCNEPLIRQLFILIKMIGYSPTLRIWKMPKLGTTLPCQIQYKVHNTGMVMNSDYYRVRSIEPIEEKCDVYNLEVETSHTYVANQIVVHNCFYLPISDCISNGEDGIFDQVKNAALIFKYGGGVGLNFSNLRPAGSTVRSTQGVSSGVISFMKNFNTMTETIKQGGKRRGALMGCLDITHPEIKNFITCKNTEGDLSNFNISVKLTDEFMRSVENNSKDELELFNLIIDGIYKNGEPGILFKDEIERHNPRPDLGELNPNPCVTGDTLILTKKYGEAPIADFVNEEIEIWNGYEWSFVTPFITGYDQQILNINIEDYNESEYIIKCTPNHTFIINEDIINTTEIRKLASELKTGDHIYPFKPSYGAQEYCDLIIKSIDIINKPAYKVYCLNEPKNHSFVANGVLIGNCAEALLPPHGSCNLGSINWSCLFKPDTIGTWKDRVYWEKYEYIIRNSTILLNRVIDKNEYPLPKIDEISRLLRQIGLGGMGFHDLLLQLQIPYDSAMALNVGKELIQFKRKISEDESKKNNFNNTSLTTIAPTGTISIIADVSSGIEPVFNWVVTRKDSFGEHYSIHPIFEKELKKECEMCHLNYDEIIKHCHQKGTIQDIPKLSQEFKDLFKNAMDISWVQHIKMQSVFQTNGVDMSISKTINLPNNATKKNISNAIFMAWKMHCKGITIYRNGSRENEVLNLESKKEINMDHLQTVTPHINKLYEIDQDKILSVTDRKDQTKITLKKIKDEEKNVVVPKEDPLKRPRLVWGGTYKIQSGCGKLYVTVNERNSKPYEVFIQSGGSGGCEAGNEALGRAISLTLRSGGDIKNIIKQLTKVKCPAALKNPNSEGKSCADIVGKLIRESIPDDDDDWDYNNTLKTLKENDAALKTLKETINKEERKGNEQKINLLEECPECHERTLVREAGCKSCHACGYNKCG